MKTELGLRALKHLELNSYKRFRIKVKKKNRFRIKGITNIIRIKSIKTDLGLKP